MSKELALNSDTLIEYFNKNLEGLSNIKEGYKLYVNIDNVIIPDEPYMFQGLWRYYNNIKRQDAIDVITQLFDNIERYYNSLYIKSCISKNKNKNINLPETVIFEFKHIVEKMKLSLLGINHLLKTYEKDPKTVELFNKIIVDVNNIISNFTKLTSTNFI